MQIASRVIHVAISWMSALARLIGSTTMASGAVTAPPGTMTRGRPYVPGMVSSPIPPGRVREAVHTVLPPAMPAKVVHTTIGAGQKVPAMPDLRPGAVRGAAMAAPLSGLTRGPPGPQGAMAAAAAGRSAAELPSAA